MNCKNCSNRSCETCKFKMKAWADEARQMKQDMLNGTKRGETVTPAQRDAFIMAAFTVLDMLEDKEAA